MLKLGLTGSIASGKSEVARLLAARGARVVDADQVAHQVYEPGAEGYALLIQAFGPEIVAPDGAIDRARLGALVFADPALRKRLTGIVWPLTAQAIAALAREHEAADVKTAKRIHTRDTKVFVVEAPLLAEAAWQSYFDQVWLVRARPETALKRLKARGLTDAEAASRLAAATDPAAAAAIAHVIIDNDGDLATLEAAVDAAWQALFDTGG